MKYNKLFVVAAGISAFVAVGMTIPYKKERKNLKVLPKDISDAKLDSIMQSYNVALGVDCNFCHAPAKDNERKLDFVSDEKPEKAIARSMMKLTVKINKKYFGAKHAVITDSTMAITCITCHHGTPHPEGK